MIEAVNSVIANASLLRSTTEQAVRARPDSSAPVEGVKGNEAPIAPFVSPYIQIDSRFNKAVLQIRDSDTGDVLKQFPSESVLEARQFEIALNESGNESEDAQVGSSSLFSVSEIASSDGGAQIATVSPSSLGAVAESAAPQVAQAQIAAAALSSGAQAGQPQSTGVSVTA